MVCKKNTDMLYLTHNELYNYFNLAYANEK